MNGKWPDRPGGLLMFWTAKRRKRLAALATKGLSAREIAPRLAGPEHTPTPDAVRMAAVRFGIKLLSRGGRAPKRKRAKRGAARGTMPLGLEPPGPLSERRTVWTGTSIGPQRCPPVWAARSAPTEATRRFIETGPAALTLIHGTHSARLRYGRSWRAPLPLTALSVDYRRHVQQRQAAQSWTASRWGIRFSGTGLARNQDWALKPMPGSLAGARQLFA